MKQFAKQSLAPISVTGMIVPWEKSWSNGKKTHYKLACNNGLDYIIAENSEVHDVLPLYCWREVKVVGLLNTSNLTLIPQKVIPKGPNDQSSNLVDLSAWKKLKMKRELYDKINELVVVPVGVLALLVS